MDELPKHKKDEILLEERYRVEIRSALQPVRSKTERITAFFNSAFVLWFLSSVLVTSLTALVTFARSRQASEQALKHELEVTKTELLSKYQMAETSANNIVRNYLLGINDAIIEANLRDKVSLKQSWLMSDFEGAINETEIKLRIDALAAILNYQIFLGEMAKPDGSRNFERAARKFELYYKTEHQGNAYGEHTNFAAQLYDAFSSISLVTVQRATVEKAMLDAGTNVQKILTLLQKDLDVLGSMRYASIYAKEAEKISNYNEIRNATSAKDLDALIVSVIHDIKTLQPRPDLPIADLVASMASAQAAVVAYRKSKETPADISILTAEIDVLNASVSLFQDTSLTQSRAEK